LKLDAKMDELGCTLGEELLKPTIIYAKPMQKVWQEYKVKHIIKALAHITGGGLVDNVPRVVPPNADVVIEKKSWEVPPIFRIIQQAGNIDEDEMFHVFNMGIGMVIIAPPFYADAIVRRIKRMRAGAVRLRAAIIGRVENGSRKVRLV
jgi:phosphoribosylformylglycinamidine cyclo-ligase